VDDRRRSWFVAHLIPRFIGAAVFAAAMYFVFDTSRLAAALYGVAFAATTASARLLWWWLGERGGRGPSSPPA
jgi:hypothetical protein